MATIATRLTSGGNLLINGTLDEVSMGGGSAYFDGNGDFLTTPNNGAFTIGTEDFTLEFWMYPTASSGVMGVVGIANSGSTGDFDIFLNFPTATGKISPNIYNGTRINSASSYSTNTWTHVAITRSSGTLKIFLNGVQDASGTFTDNISKDIVVVGRPYATFVNTEYFNGYLSNLRLIKGTALYTANFIPSISILDPVPNTSLLLNFANSETFLTDRSTNNFTVTRNGDTAFSTLTPFNRGAFSVSSNIAFTKQADEVTLSSGSIDLNGTNQYLSVADNPLFDFGTGDFTLECWIYIRSFKGDEAIIGQWAVGNMTFLWNYNSTIAQFAAVNIFGSYLVHTVSYTYPTGRWFHTAVCRSGTNVRIFSEGNQIGATYNIGTNEIRTTGTTPVAIGRKDDSNYYIDGLISNLRVIKGRALYTANFIPQLSVLDPSSDTSLLINPFNSNEITRDKSFNSLAITNNNGVTFSSSNPFNSSNSAIKERRFANATLWAGIVDEFTGAPVIDSSLVSWLDAGQSISYPGSGTTWTNITGAGNNGTLTSGPTFNTRENSIVFDGVDDYVALGTFTNMGTTTNRTYSIWGKIISSTASVKRLVSFVLDDTFADTPTFTIGYSTVAGVITLNAGMGGTPYDGYSSSISVSANTWFNFCVTISSNTLNFYQNGVFLEQKTNTGSVATSPIGYIGRYNGAYGQYLSGEVACFSYYNRTLSADEVAQNFNALRRRFGI